MPPTPSQPDPTNFARRVDELRQELHGRDPFKMAEHTGAAYTGAPDAGEFRLPLWGRETLLPFPELIARDGASGAELPAIFQAVLMYHFHRADGASLAGRWVSFADLPDGRFYVQAFNGYTGRELARIFGNDLPAFAAAAAGLGGQPVPAGPHTPGDLAFSFSILPRLPLLVVAWAGDEDFPASYQLLFDASAGHYLSSDGCAILGSMLTKKLIAARRT